MRKEFIVERQGRSFCLYAGLLDQAHQQGLKSITTELIQAPSEANNRVAICSAIVVMEQDGMQRVFSGIGDAAPNNVAPAMQTCLLRMAETRAKARALRDAVNIGVAAFEELGDEDAHDGPPERGYETRGPRTTRRTPAPREQPAAAGSPPARHGPATLPNDPATDAQHGAIQALCDRQKRDVTTFLSEELGAEVGLIDLTSAQAAELIRKLNTPARATA